MLSRREFLLAAGATAATTLAGRSSAFAADVDPLLAGRPLVRYPEKTDLILLTARPPQLETPLSYFDRAITPNDAFFVRYHIFPIPTSVDLDQWRLGGKGDVGKTPPPSLDDPQKISPAPVAAVAPCPGDNPGRLPPPRLR